MHPMLITAVKAARRAGAIINRASLELDKLQVSRKGPRNYVTDIDIAAEQAIVDILSNAYPSHSILAEESGSIQPADGTKEAEYQWIIDPLDGTTNFIHGYPFYAISIALMHNGQAAHALIYDSNRDELFTASRGGGAFLNDRRIRVSGRSRYSEALLSEHAGRVAGDSATRNRFEHLLASCGSVRRGGSAVLDLAYVAAGRSDGFCGLKMKPWDMAAGALLVLEAGGLVGDFHGDQTWMETGDIMAATPKIFPQMISHLQVAENNA